VQECFSKVYMGNLRLYAFLAEFKGLMRKIMEIFPCKFANFV
jgi:hypothetical protein